jgi:putative flavoprotein involved in K+ transport
VRRIDTIVVGGGQAGLAMSRCLSDRRIENVVLERGRVAERWRSERWDSLRLLTPNWQSRLPGFRYQGSDGDGYMTMPEIIDFLEKYAASFSAPIEDRTTVLGVERASKGFRVTTDRGSWESSNLVIATGHSDVPFVPAFASGLRLEFTQVTPSRYRHPGQLPSGGVLVVGASSSGVQLADEIHRSGRSVTLAVGHHTRMPRCYRGRDILWWLDRMGVFDERVDDLVDGERSRRQPSLQLVGTPERRSLDLPSLEAMGVRLVGTVTGTAGSRLSLADDLVAHAAAADVKLARLLARIDDFVAREALSGSVGEPEPFVPFHWPAPAPTELDLRAEGIRTVLWATGFHRRYPWLKVPVLDERGEIRHQGGITDAPGLYVLGLHFLRRRKSNFIDGVGDDAFELAGHIHARRLRATA